MHYINQFFAGIGAEEKADVPVGSYEGPVGPGKRLQDLLGDSAKIVVTTYCGDNYFSEHINEVLERIQIRQVKTGEKSALEISGIFIAIGLDPSAGYLKELLPLDAHGYITTNEKMETTIPGIFAAGDIRHNSARQAVTAAGDGATAAIYAEKFITELSFR